MDLTQLRAFVGIVDAGGVSRASERLHSSQPALSRQLQALESDLGVALFTREQRRLLLTSAGEDLLGRARALIADAEMLMARAKALRSGTMGVLRLGATPPMIEGLLGKFLCDWRARHPGIELHLVEDGGSSLAERLDSGDVHLAYIPAGDARFDYELLYPIHVVAAVARANALARSRCLEIAELRRCPLLVLRSGFGSRDWFDSACKSAGIHTTLALESSSHGAILALAAADFGIGILPSAIASVPEETRLVPLAHEGVPIGRWTMMAWSKRRPIPSFASIFVKDFSVFARKHHPGRDVLRRAPRIPLPAGSISPRAPGSRPRGSARPARSAGLRRGA